MSNMPPFKTIEITPNQKSNLSIFKSYQQISTSPMKEYASATTKISSIATN
jgi:hypothetical protein